MVEGCLFMLSGAASVGNLELSFLGLSSTVTSSSGHHHINHNNSSSPSSSSSPTDSDGLLSNGDVQSFFNQAIHHSSGGGGCGNGGGPTSSLLTSNLNNSDSDDDLLQYPQCILGGGPLFSSPSAHLMTPEDLRAFILPKKSQNMTECVPVPSSEHVAEIVGRQGCKIKALRAKTNTYIKTPVRGEEPVFVVTGRKEDVGLAKREILSAADHFSQIRASRKTNGNTNGTGSPTCAPTPVPGQVTIQVRVPYRVVGLVVGPKGATIKRIQQQTHTYIVTPSRDKDPVFEVTGLPDNVQMARREIEAHIAIRTGSLPQDNNGLVNMNDELTSSQTELLASIYKNGLQGLEGLQLGLGLGLGLGALNSLSSSLSSVSGLGGQIVGSSETGTAGSTSSGGGSLSSLNLGLI